MNIDSIKNFLKDIDRFLFVGVIILAFFGLAVIYSTSFGTDKIVNFQKQVVFSAIGIALMIGAALVDYRTLKTYSGILYVIAVLILGLTLIVSYEIRGAYSWLNLGGFSIEPSEFVKLILVIILAKFFSTRNTGELRYVLLSAVYAGVLIGLVFLQPDIGMAAVFFAIWILMLFVSGAKFKHLAAIVVFTFVFSAGSWNFVLKDYQKARIWVFLNPAQDPLGRGYNVIQAKIAVGSGGLLGKGFARGTQSQLNFLPEKYSDFIFAALAEEFGFLGIGLLFLIFLFIFSRIFSVIKKVNDAFGKMLIFGIGVMIFSGFFINIAANISLLPVTGLTLPLISYGGSSLLATLLSLGIIQSVIIRNKQSYKIKQNIIDE
ncbi:rod shape-determining protein RodA [Patescibacteria group bacterium]|nr:rod shape-determining protein RodA [Patescibacteria group bacterium]MBU4000260.1 rod shape-determining protein RodA [Patescibacteria group bacterium]MBU4056433.1 rod shape-determining protein RodA [Patescibacteria group bacterium]MBU4368510.1 rod shape-determining protein RodA [Patescibacteria group bacterium]